MTTLFCKIICSGLKNVPANMKISKSDGGMFKKSSEAQFYPK